MGKERNGDLGGMSFSGCHDKQFNAYKKTSKTLAMKISFSPSTAGNFSCHLKYQTKNTEIPIENLGENFFLRQRLELDMGKKSVFYFE